MPTRTRSTQDNTENTTEPTTGSSDTTTSAPGHAAHAQSAARSHGENASHAHSAASAGFDGAHSTQSGSEYDPSGATAAALGAFATHSIQQGLQNLNLDPQLMEVGQQAIAASMNLVAPIRKAFKSNPVLVGSGLASIAVGGVLVGLALLRDNNISLRQLRPTKTKFEN